jgi:DNA excision repair protein ERCC-2
MKKITIGVRDFALPVPRTGSIEVNSGYASLPANGQELHVALQKKRESEFYNYRSEVKVTHNFERGGFKFAVSGQIDGVFDAIANGNSGTLVEEIKTSFDVYDLQHKLKSNPDHPYAMQLKTYIYLLMLSERVVPQGRFLLLSSRTGDSLELPINFDRDIYEAWLDKRLDELVIEAEQQEADATRRKAIARTITFPFSTPRQSQLELIDSVEAGLEKNEPMLIQAPTGLGKTIGVMFPVVKEAFSRGQTVVYVTPKNSQHSVAEDAIKRLQKKQPKLRALTITAKSKLCFKAEQICNPQYCEYAQDYYQKIYENDLVNKMTKHKHLSAQNFRDYGENYKVCPFELSVDSLGRADVVVGDYNYVFSPRSLLGRLSTQTAPKKDKPNLIVDEAHNLPGRAADYYSGSLSTYSLQNLKDELLKRTHHFVPEGLNLIGQGIQIIYACKPKDSRLQAKLETIPDTFREHNEKLRDFLVRYLNSKIEIDQKDPILKLCGDWLDFTSALEFEGENFFATYAESSHGAVIKITCCDASEKLKAAHDAFSNIVAFSATLKPFEYYAKLCGFKSSKTKTMEFQTPFPKGNRKLIVIPQVSTKYSDRDRNYEKIAQAIMKITDIRRGNYFVFFPSFGFLEAVARLCSFERFQMIKQTPEMRPSEVNRYIDWLKGQQEPTLIFAVQGGVFSEGVDYPGESVIGAIIVGPALPNYNLERELLRGYYEKNYGSGFEYAYTYPAMAKVIQSAGRVIRSESDRGLIVLMDRRFIESSYVTTMPDDWFDNSINELVSDSILSDIQTFWKESERQDESIA